MTRIFAAVLLSFALIAPVFAGDEKDEATYRKIESQLESTTIDTLAYEDADVTEVVKDIAKKARVTIVFDKAALEGVGEEDRKITLELAEIKAMNALNIVVDQIGLFKQYKNGILYITTEEKAAEATVTKTYDVRDITVKINDFPAPKLRLKGEDSDGGFEIELPDDETDVETDDIVEMIEDSVEADWGGTATVTVSQGQLIVRATRSVQKDVAELIDQLRASK
jgi:type II secretory pathway component GspD/PulD (secretin)